MYIDRIRINWDKVSPDSYLTRIPAISLLQELAFRRPVTFFVGENGTGEGRPGQLHRRRQSREGHQDYQGEVTPAA